MRRLALVALVVLATGPAAAETLRIDGEVYARRSAALLPPAVDQMWQFNITQLAPDGAPVKAGDVVVAFDPTQLVQRLTAKQSELAEKQRALEALLLDLAERRRNESLATEEARSVREKAARKTEQPEGIVPGVEYRKLVVARDQAEARLVLFREREALAVEQRRQEERLLASEVAKLQAEVAELQASIAALQVPAPRDGLMMHKSNWNGEKYDVGSQVWRGQSVAEIPDTGTLAVRAELPERDLLRVRPGAPVRVVVEGGAGPAVAGRVEAIGRAVRSKSRVQPVPVIDLEIALADPGTALRPGQAVRVEVQATAPAPAAGAGVSR